MRANANIPAVIRQLEKKGAPIIGVSYINAEGVPSERDLQIGVRRDLGNPLPWGKKVSKSLVLHKGQTYIQAIDRNRSKALRRENKELSLHEADRLSFRAFRADRVMELRYGDK